MALSRILLICWMATAWAVAEDTAAVLQMLKALRAQPAGAILDAAWPYLDAENPAIREAARTTIQAVPFREWRDRAIEEKSTWASLEILRALVDSCPREAARELSPHLCEQITTLRIEQMDAAQLLAAQRLTKLVFERLGPVSEDERHQMLDLWSSLPMPSDAAVARDRKKLIEYLTTARPGRP